MTKEKTFIVDQAWAGARLDRFLSEAAGVGLRAARRLVLGGAVRVEGKARGCGFKLGLGQRVALAGPEPVAFAPSPRLVIQDGSFAAFFKPSGLHTAAICGSFEPSLEAMLPELLPGRAVLLVNRLDRDTSGLVLGAFGEAQAARFRELEDAGRVEKRYLALVQGALTEPMTLKWSLDTANTPRTKVLDVEAPDALRWTGVRPVARHGGFSLVEARIAKGARHQIRAHLARAGHAIVGDALYGGPEDGSLRLHHWSVFFPDFLAQAAPAWDELQVLIERFMEEPPCASAWPSRP